MIDREPAQALAAEKNMAFLETSARSGQHFGATFSQVARKPRSEYLAEEAGNGEAPRGASGGGPGARAADGGDPHPSPEPGPVTPASDPAATSMLALPIPLASPIHASRG